MIGSHHEQPNNAQDIPRASNRSVGLVLAVFFGIVGAWPLLNGVEPPLWSLGIACGLIVLALGLPRALTPITWLWLGIGKVLHVLVSPVVLGLVYLVAVLPTGIYVRLSGKDPLRLKRNADADSYWIPREPPGPDPKSLPQQF
jgi:hypothetical protein